MISFFFSIQISIVVPGEHFYKMFIIIMLDLANVLTNIMKKEISLP